MAIASQENPESGTSSEEGGARAAILGAARKVAQREGVLEMTLTAVAREARVDATDVYAFFTSKNDLLQAVVADDLAALAKTMRRSLEHQPDGEEIVPPAAVDDATIHLVAETHEGAAAEPVPDDCQPENTQVSSMQSAESVPTNEQDAPDAHESPAIPNAPRRFPVVQGRRDASRQGTADSNAGTAEAIAQLQEAVAKLEACPVDQWLERRLREFERTLYALQHNRNQRAAANSVEGIRESIEALDIRHTMAAEESARAVGERFDASDKRLRETLSDMQAESVHLARRITALENLAFASRPEQMPPPVETFTPAGKAETAVEPTQETIEETYDATPDGDETMPSYLAAARRSAQVAAQEANEDLRQKPVVSKPKKTLLYAACGSFAAFVVVLAGVGFALRESSMNGGMVAQAARTAPVHVAHRAVPKPPQRFAQKAPMALHRLVQKARQPALLQLAQTGDASAELLVGLEYLEGKGEPKNDAMAVDWLSRAAAKGQPVAQYDLGALYADGRGVPEDAVQAFQWFGSAALRGNRRAMHFLAIAYAEGVGTTKDLPEAARWFERAAALGAVNSQFNLAVLYERGMGVPQSLTTAYKWYAIAAAQGDREAEARVTALGSTLKPDDLGAAKTAASSFKPEPLDPAANLPPKLPS